MQRASSNESYKLRKAAGGVQAGAGASTSSTKAVGAGGEGLAELGGGTVGLEAPVGAAGGAGAADPAEHEGGPVEQEAPRQQEHEVESAEPVDEGGELEGGKDEREVPRRPEHEDLGAAGLRSMPPGERAAAQQALDPPQPRLAPWWWAKSTR